MFCLLAYILYGRIRIMLHKYSACFKIQLNYSLSFNIQLVKSKCVASNRL